MRWILSLTALTAVLYWAWNSSNQNGLPFGNVMQKVEQWLRVGHFHTVVARYTAEQIMQKEARYLLKDQNHKFLDPQLQFYPYILLEIKYSLSDEKTREGTILWDLSDGEMVLDTKTWEKTHGFGDYIQAKAQTQDFKILNFLAKKGGACDREALSKSLRVENETLDGWIDNCRKKKLIVQSGNRYRLHLQNPKFPSSPETLMEERLVTKPYHKTVCSSRIYSLSQIQMLAKAAFGRDFTIRKSIDLYLPVHCIAVQNPDGSIHTTYWNALNGKQLQ
jgi:hypothetical protein